MANHPNEIPGSDTPLDSWKEIAAYLQRDVSTAMRWEKSEELPVHRHQHSSRASVYAFPSELDAWKAARKPQPDESRLWRRWVPALASSLALLAVAAFIQWGPILHPPDPLAAAADIGGGVRLRQVWTHDEVDTSGSISPDGRFLCFVYWATGDLAVQDFETGEHRRLTNKGSWKVSSDFATGAAFSPDGGRIAYSWHNSGEGKWEIRLLPAEANQGATTAKVLYSISDDVVEYPMVTAWSPDGQHILVLMSRPDSASQITLVPSSGGEVQVLRSIKWSDFPAAKFSPDSRFIAYDAQADDDPRRDIFLLAVDGTREIQAVRHPANDQMLGWSPDAKALLFASDRGGTTGIWSQPLEDGRPAGEPEMLQPDVGRVKGLGVTSEGALYYGLHKGMRDVFTAELSLASGKLLGEPRRIQSLSVGANLAPAWSPDGKSLVYVRRAAGGPASPAPVLVLRSLATDSERTISPGGVQLFPNYGGLHWSPDGRSIISGAQDTKGARGTYRIDLAQGTTSRLSGPAHRYAIPAGWSADGEEVFYRFSQSSAEGQAKVWLLFARNLETGEEREVFRHEGEPISSGAVSPNGRHIALEISTDEPTGQDGVYIHKLVVMSADGHNQRELVKFKGRGAFWSPDSRYLYFLKTATFDDSELWRVPFEGGDLENTGLTGERIRNLRFHPDGRRVAYSAGRGRREIWVIENFLPELRAAK